MAMVRVSDEVHAALSARAGVERRSLQATLELLLEKGGLALNGSALTEPEPGSAAEQQAGGQRDRRGGAAVKPAPVSGSVSVESGGEPGLAGSAVGGEELSLSESPPVKQGCWDHRDNPRHWCLACKAEA